LGIFSSNSLFVLLISIRSNIAQDQVGNKNKPFGFYILEHVATSIMATYMNFQVVVYNK
jgi:hypothetical protein